MAGSSGGWLGDPGAFHSEGAYWDPVIGGLRYLDMLRGDILTNRDGRDERANVAGVVALVRPRLEGGYLVATERGFALLDDALQVVRRIRVFDDPDLRMNEGACDAAGRLYCGSLAYDYRPNGGKLYRLDPDLSVHVALDSVTIPNGLVWTDGGAAALHADTADRKVHRYEFDAIDGSFGHRETFIDFADAPGAPDGMALDAEGGLWVALWGGHSVRRYNADGKLTDTIELPVTNATSCAIGGESGTTLFVTTSRQGLGERAEEHAGRVFVQEIGVRAGKVHSFGGR